MNGHVDSETVAALREGLLPRRRAARVASHLSHCPHCASTDARLTEMTALLSAPPAPPLPAEIAARLDAALADEAASRSSALPAPSPKTAPGSAHPAAAARSLARRAAGVRPGRPGRLALRVAVTAAALVIAAGGAYGLSRLTSPGTGSAASSSAAGGSSSARRVAGGSLQQKPPQAGTGASAGGIIAGTSYRVVASGINYRPGRLRAQVEAMLTRYPASAGQVNGRQSPTPAASVRRDLAGCVQRVVAGHHPELVDVARYDGRPADVIVATGGGSRTVWVVRAGCQGPGGGVITSFSLPGGS